MQLQRGRCQGLTPATAAASAPWALPPAACTARPVQPANLKHSLLVAVAAPVGMHRSAVEKDRHRRAQRLGSLPGGEGVPEDAHHNPQETPEQWLLTKEHAASPDHPKQQQQQQHAPGGKAAKRTVPYLGLEVTPELVAISMVYFVQGILGLSRLALSFFFKDDLGVEPAQVAVLTGLAGLPWVVKPVYGFISDSIPLFGYRRRSYLMLCGLAGSVSWLALATVVHSPTAAVGAMLLGSLSTACSDVVVDSLVVERARGEPAATAGSLQSLCWGSSAIGGIMSAYFSGSLVEQYGSTTVFVLTAIFPLIVSASALLIDEQWITTGQRPAAAAAAAVAHAADSGQWQQSQQPRPPPQHEQLAISTAGSSSSSWSSGLAQQLVHQGGALWGAVKQKHILLPTVFVFLWQATPTADTAMFYFYTNELHFTPEFLGRVRLAGSIASLAGVALYNGVFKQVPLKKMLLGAMLLGVTLGATQLILVSGANRALGLSDELFVLGDSVILTVLGQVSFMPILVLAARLCPEGVEATLFATLMSILNGGSFVGSALGAGLTAYLGVSSTDFSNLFLLVLLCNFSTLLPAPFLGLLPSLLDQEGLPGSAAAAADGDSKQQDSSSSSSSSLQQGPHGTPSKASVQLRTQGGGVGKGVAGGRSGSEVSDDEGVPLKSGQRD